MSKAKTRRISADVPLLLAEQIDAALKALRIKSRSALIEVSCRAFLEDANLHAKVKDLETQLKLARAKVGTVTRGRETARNERDAARADLDAARAELADMKSQRDEFEKKLHAETDAYNKCYERAESQKKARDYFKVKYEASQAEAAAAKSKLAAYQKQGFWGRLFRQLPIPIPYVEPTE